MTPRPLHRTVAPDVTGYWEVIPPSAGPNRMSPMLVQVNQAGGVAVLWFTRPARGVEGVDPLPLPDVRAGGAPRGWIHGVGSAVLRGLDGVDRSRSGADLTWLAVSMPADGEPAAADPFNPLDPSHLYGPPSGLDLFEGNGRLSSDGDTLTLDFGASRTGHAVSVRLRRLRTGARLPRAVLDTVPVPLHTALLIETVRPIPSQLERQLLGLFAPEWAQGEPRLAALLRRWHATPQATLARDGPRSAIGAAVAFGLDEPWRTTMLDRMILAARSNVLSIDGVTKTYAGWLTDVLAEEEAANRPQRRTESVRVRTVVRPLSSAAAETFAYTLTFSDVGGQAPWLGQRGTSRGISAAFYGVLVGLTKEAIRLERDKHGAVVHDDAGRARIDASSRRPVALTGATAPVIGLFGRLETGLALKDLKAPAAGPKTWNDYLAAGDLGSVTFTSSLDLGSTTDLDGALLVVTSVVLGAGKFGNWLKMQAADSTLWELRLSGGRRLSAIVDGDPVKGPKIGNFLSATKKSWWNNWKPSSIDVALFRLAVGYGVLFTPSSWVAQARKLAPPPSGGNTTTANAPVTARLSTFFDYDSALLEDPRRPELGALPRRVRLEERVAELRGVLTSPGPPLVLLGMTSPEGAAGENRMLSLNRARAVEQAIVDALGPLSARGRAACEPLGEGPATATSPVVVRGIRVPGGHLPDPEVTGIRTPDPRWPQWRRVEVYVDGGLAITMTDKPATSTQP